jgi:PKHD-type hydroxylase
MLLHIPKVLDPQQLATVRDLLNQNEECWIDGLATTGPQSTPVKFNQQCNEHSEVAAKCQQIVLSALEHSPLFISAVLPNVVYPPMFSRYSEGMNFGAHVDGSVRVNPKNGMKLRTDVSATLFLSEPSEYEGGELQIIDTYGMHSAKLAAGDMLIHSSTSLYQITPITKGTRTTCFFWIQSMIKDDAERTLLFDLDNAIQKLNLTQADEAARRSLIGCYHNLVRQWSEV